MLKRECGPEDVDEDRFTEIVRLAYYHWEEFKLAKKISFDSESFFDRRAQINRHVLGFFKYCAQICHGATGAVIVPTNLSRYIPAPQMAPSWLWHNGGGVPYILIDFDQVLSKVSYLEQHKTISRLVLHEIGHAVLHFKDLMPKGIQPVISAKAKMENEAWIFCGTILGLALGDVAVNGRKKSPPNTDEAWPHA